MNLTEGDIAWTVGPRAQPLGEKLQAGAAGNIYRLPEPRPQLARIYRDDVDLARYERKIAAMLDVPPDLPEIIEDDERHVQMAWPTAALRDGKGQFAGFLMPAVDLGSTYELEWILQERQARGAGLLLGLAARIALAANIASAIAELHECGHHVVDLNPGKLRFNARSHNTAILDCDSFSIQGKNERFGAEYATTEALTADYLAPEFHDQPIPPEGEESQDRFALAVLVFQLINFGLHPFSGIPTDDQVPSDIQGRIVQRCYAYGVTPHPAMQPHPVSGHLAVPDELRSLFDQAFESDGSARPSARDWVDLLKPYVQPWNKLLQACAAVAAHQHFVELPCAACARAELIVRAANASDLSLVFVQDPMALGVKPFGAPQTAADVVPASEWQAAMPINMPLPREEPPKGGVPKGVVTSIKAAASVMAVAIGIKFGFVAYAHFTAPPPAGHRFVAEPVDPPAAPSPDPDLMGFPSMEKEEALTERYAKTAALAIAKGDRTGWDKAMNELRTRVPAHQASPPDGHHAAFATFAASITPESYSERQRQDLIGDLHQALRDNPYDDEAASELGWLSLLGGQRDEAKKFYAHAIWVNPDRANAWYGFGVVSGNDQQTTGALAAAELLTADPTEAQQMRDTFPPLMLRLCGIKPEVFGALRWKAEHIAQQNRPVAATPAASSPAASSPAVGAGSGK